MNKNIECYLTLSLHKLDRAKCEVNRLLCKGVITQEFADIVMFKLNKAQDAIAAILCLISPAILY